MTEHRTVIGIDPGLDGAIAVMDGIGSPVVYDMPTVRLEKSGGGHRRDYELKELWLKIILGPFDLMVIERLQPMPSDKRGMIGAFSIGRSLGILEGMATALGKPFIRVLPTVWKRRYGLLGQGKQASRVRAMERFPTVDLSKKKHDGRADALWLALYGMEVER